MKIAHRNWDYVGLILMDIRGLNTWLWQIHIERATVRACFCGIHKNAVLGKNEDKELNVYVRTS